MVTINNEQSTINLTGWPMGWNAITNRIFHKRPFKPLPFVGFSVNHQHISISI